MSTVKLYKKLPTLDPDQFNAWSTAVRSAFEYHKWSEYLRPPSDMSQYPSAPTPASSTSIGTEPIVTPAPTGRDPEIEITTRAYLIEAIPFQMYSKFYGCTYTYEIWEALNQEYSYRSRQDQLRLELELTMIRKTAEENLDQFIERFEKLSAHYKDQNPNCPSDRINSYFLLALERANIPHEKWPGFITYLGNRWPELTERQLHAQARSYYAFHIVPDIETAKKDAQVRAAKAQAKKEQKQRNTNNNDDGGSSQQNNNRSNSNSYRGSKRNNYPRDKNAYCTHCKCPGHSYDMCVNKTRNSNAYCDNCQRKGHSTENCYSKPRSDNDNKRNSNNNPSGSAQTPNPSNAQQPPAMARNRTIKVHYIDAKQTIAYPWIYDSCCTETMTRDPMVFQSYKLFDKPIEVSGVGADVLLAYGSGTIALKSTSIDNSVSDYIHEMHDVYYVPDLDCNIISKVSAKESSNIKLYLDDYEEFQLTSTIPGSDFELRTATIDRTTTIINLIALEYDPNYFERAFTARKAITYGANRAKVNNDSDVSSELWHQRLGHPGIDKLKQLGIKGYHPSKDCVDCALGKHTRTPFYDNPSRSLVKLHRIYSDLCGDIKPASILNYKYILVFVDEATRYSWIYLLKDRSAASVRQSIEEWLPQVQNQAETNVKFILTDGGKEYLNCVAEYLTNRGIQQDKTTASSSASNGMAERMNRILLDIARPLLASAKLPAPFWSEAIDTANKIRNRLPSKALKGRISPHQAWFGIENNNNIHKLRRFGCLAYAKNLNIPDSHKADLRSIECLFLGYDSVDRGIYRLWNPATAKLIKSRDVIFFEDKNVSPESFDKLLNRDIPLQIPEFTAVENIENVNDNTSNERYAVRIAPPIYRPSPSATVGQQAQRQYLIPPPKQQIDEEDSSSSDSESFTSTSDSDTDTDTGSGTDTNVNATLPVVSTPIERSSTPAPAADAAEAEVEQVDTGTRSQATQPPTEATSEPKTTRAGRQLKQTERGKAAMQALKPKQRKKQQARPIHTSNVNISGIYIEPLSYAEAISRFDADNWIEAMDSELNSHRQNCTWSVVHRPDNRKIVGTKWVFKLKDPESLAPRYKARLVAQGFSQIEGIDYNETYASVVKTVSVKQLLAYAALNRLYCYHFDVVTAYLNSNVRETIYCELPPGYHIDDPQFNNGNYVLLLNKALYGLKQSAFEWSDTFRDAMFKLGYEQSTEDDNIYVRHAIIVAIYVDDLLVLAPTVEQINDLHEDLSQDFTIRNLGPVKKFLSLDIHRNGDLGDISITQTTYIHRLLKRYGMDTANPAKTPCQRSVILHKRLDDEEAADETEYRSIVGSLQHAAVMLRFDIAYATSRLAQYLSNPSTIHLSAAKHVLRYLCGYPDLGVTYSSANINALNTFPLIYSDASFASDPDDRKSTTGWLTLYNGGVISHSSKKQDLIALSTMESEYAALCEGVREATFQFKLLQSLNPSFYYFPVVHTDSKPAFDHVKNNVHHARTKHFDLKLSYVRQAYNSGNVDIIQVPSEEQLADILTKPLSNHKHHDALRALNFDVINSGNCDV